MNSDKKQEELHKEVVVADQVLDANDQEVIGPVDESPVIAKDGPDEPDDEEKFVEASDLRVGDKCQQTNPGRIFAGEAADNIEKACCSLELAQSDEDGNNER